MQNYIEHFSDVCDFISKIESRTTNIEFNNIRLSSEIRLRKNSKEGLKRFYDTGSYSVAAEEIINGRNVELQELTEKTELLTTNFLTCRKIYEKSPAGGTINIMAYNAGSPFCRRRKVAKKVRTNVIELNYCCSVSCNIESSELIAETAKMLSAIKILTAKGYAIQLNLLFCAYAKAVKEMQYIGGLITLKDYRSQLNARNLSYTLCSSSILRRHFFKFIENCPQPILSQFSTNYGYPVYDCKALAELFKKDEKYIYTYKTLKELSLYNLIQKLTTN